MATIPRIRWIALFMIAILLKGVPCGAQEQQPSSGEVTADPWPRVIDEGGIRYTIYQLQRDRWDGYHFSAYAAVSVLPAGAKASIFGMIDITASTRKEWNPSPFVSAGKGELRKECVPAFSGVKS